MGSPQFSVIVLNWNGKHFLPVCLSALRRQTFQDVEIILVDNGSEDGSATFTREHFPEVKVVRLARNLGFVGGNLAGYERAQGHWIVLLNNDTEPAANWLAALDRAAQEFPTAGSLASKMLKFDQRTMIDNCGFDLTGIGMTIDLGRDTENGPNWGKSRQVFGACGGAAAYRRRMLEDVEFLDQEFSMTYEDVDLSFRAQLRGYECIFVPEAVVYHHWRGTMAHFPSKQVYYSQRNIEFLYIKNMPLRLMLRYFPQRLLYELGAAAYFARMGEARSFVSAKLDVVKQLPTLLRKRKSIQKRRTISIAQLESKLQKYELGPGLRKLLSAWCNRARTSPRTFPKPI